MVKSPNLDLKQGISYLERERGERERERRTKLGAATGNFLSGERDGERYGLVSLYLVYVFIIPKIPGNALHNS